MRRYYKSQCTETFRLLTEAHTEIARYIERNRPHEAFSLIEQCQQGAISVGNMIDSMEGRGTEAVHCLEEYCELLYQSFFRLKQGDSVNPHQLQKSLKISLAKAERCILYDIPTQQEAVFLPYKASMWDSLESVWKAADEDPDCHAVVMPIPYYDRNPDGSFGTMHYEINKFPSCVPVVEYGDYDLESRHPEMIFIHNPYDEGNLVTSVHPDFYSEKLKKYTDRLIYIPYFILKEIDPSDKEAVKRIEHFCITSGIVNADYAVVQSEAMKQIYVNALTEHFGEGSYAYWDKKILGLGSPKVDRVCSLKEEDFTLPHAWEKLLYREDGSRKKAVFYNTSVNALLKDGEALLRKIRTNLQIFYENREEIVLLWRPHPLSEATLASMRPQLLGEYKEIVRKYRREEWGIYDDSANLDRAIAVSDGYYGDWSSVVWLYQKTGKPVMIQNTDWEETDGD